MFSPGWPEFYEKTKKGNLIPVYREILADLETPVSAFLKIDNGEYSFLLESVEGSEQIARYSFLGSNPLCAFICKGNKVTLVQQKGKSQVLPLEQDPLDTLKQFLGAYKAVLDESLPPFFGGAVGYMSYDAVKYFEKISSDPKKDALKLPHCVFLIADTLLVFDHFKHTITVISNALLSEHDDPVAVYEKTCNKIDALVQRLKQPLKIEKPEETALPPVPLNSNFSREDFFAAVGKAKEYIRAGDVVQVVLSQRLKGKIHTDPFTIYRVLRTINPSPYMFYFKAGDLHLVGASPEMLVRVQGDEVETRPIAGTRSRGKDAIEDELLANELLTDSKERAEHIMLVDLGRNDLGRVCVYGSVEVKEFMHVEKYSHVMHLASQVRGRLHHGFDRFDCLRACFPAGTVSGAPKIRAMEIIEEMEPNDRGPYAGAVGYFSFDGNMDTCITIRTIMIKKDIVYIQAGAGIVVDSEPEKEYEEIMNKAKALVKAVSLAEEKL